MKGMMLGMLMFTTLGAAAAKTGAVKAEWRSYYYRGPNYRRYACADALSALRGFLSVIGARNVEARCSWNYGLSADWQALAPVKKRESAQAIAALLSSTQGPFAGLGSAWEALASENAVAAVWRAVTFQRSMNDIRACNIIVDVYDYLFTELAVRKVSQTVFCNTGSSYIYTQFEYLAPAGRDRASLPSAATKPGAVRKSEGGKNG